MGETKRPVALWKGIAGTAASGFVLLITFVFFLVYYIIEKRSEFWVILFILVAFIIGMISLIISIYNTYEALEYKKQINENRQTQPSKNNAKKSELLHKLLAEGRITIEEYDELNK